MSPSDWPQADPALERAYRRLLHAYPRSFRNRHGAEIVTTLLEMAEPGRRHPTAIESWHLLAAGTRQRFRLPAGRPLAWLAAVLALLAGGALGAAGGSWAAEQTLAPLPSAAQGREVLGLVTGRAARLEMDEFSGAPVGGTALSGSADVWHAAWDPQPAADRLTAHGWQVGPLTATDRMQVPISGPEIGFDAVRDGLRLTVNGESDVVRARIEVADNGLLRPAAYAGLLAGALAGWLVTASVLRRRSWAANATAALALAMWFAPVWTIYQAVLEVMPPHAVLRPSFSWTLGPAWLSPLLVQAGHTAGAGLVAAGALLAVITVALSRSRPRPDTGDREVAL